ncbi:MAG: hypothetical protein J0L92_19260 [Deltaproteobacteria bacterium]|nr:hypothetical protein [Deltaproteobacteria bacterium]
MPTLTAQLPSPRFSKNAPIFQRGFYWDFAQLLTGKRDVASLHAHCARLGVGWEELTLRADGKRAYFVLLEAHRRTGLCFPVMGAAAIARLVDGRFVGEDAELCRALDAVLATLPPTKALRWDRATRPKHEGDEEDARAKPARGREKVAVGRAASTAICELHTAHDAEALTDAQRAQLASAAPGLLGAKTIAKLFSALREDESVVSVRIDVNGAPRWDGWLMGALEDGVFFEHGSARPSGLVISQGDVHDETANRVADIALLTTAVKTLRMPRKKAVAKKAVAKKAVAKKAVAKRAVAKRVVAKRAVAKKAVAKKAVAKTR